MKQNSKEHRSDRRVAVITGASSGIGRAIAHTMAREGYALALASRSAEALARLNDELSSMGCESISAPTDVTRESDIHSLVAATMERFGCIDAIVCSAGQYIRGRAVELSSAEFLEAMAINFHPCIQLIYAVLPQMLQRRSGAVVVISSVDGKKGLPLDAPYVASKFALTGFMDVLRQELHGTGVQAITVLPARVNTPMIASLRVPWISKKTTPEHVARVTMRALRRERSGEVIVPYAGPKLLIITNALWPRLADALVRLFHLEGVQQFSKNERNAEIVT
ncbi:MAG: SDR family NAD(P)-dependent oxidoreductase [Ignavibacteriae bacterium]|nr:SDR family NAD(P)-dependent oxidoreductase [Ignavibacteriota bacterium]